MLREMRARVRRLEDFQKEITRNLEEGELKEQEELLATKEQLDEAWGLVEEVVQALEQNHPEEHLEQPAVALSEREQQGDRARKAYRVATTKINSAILILKKVDREKVEAARKEAAARAEAERRAAAVRNAEPAADVAKALIRRRRVTKEKAEQKLIKIEEDQAKAIVGRSMLEVHRLTDMLSEAESLLKETESLRRKVVETDATQKAAMEVKLEAMEAGANLRLELMYKAVTKLKFDCLRAKEEFEYEELQKDKAASIAATPTITPTFQFPSGGHSQVLTEKVKFPKFDGRQTNYITFKNKWKKLVKATKIDEEMQYFHLMESLPTKDSKMTEHRGTLVKAWEYLEEEYGMSMTWLRSLCTSCTTSKSPRLPRQTLPCSWSCMTGGGTRSLTWKVWAYSKT